MLNRVETSAFIFHGTGGYPEENWFPWMKEKLTDRGVSVNSGYFNAVAGYTEFPKLLEEVDKVLVLK